MVIYHILRCNISYIRMYLVLNRSAFWRNMFFGMIGFVVDYGACWCFNRRFSSFRIKNSASSSCKDVITASCCVFSHQYCYSFCSIQDDWKHGRRKNDNFRCSYMFFVPCCNQHSKSCLSFWPGCSLCQPDGFPHKYSVYNHPAWFCCARWINY